MPRLLAILFNPTNETASLVFDRPIDPVEVPIQSFEIRRSTTEVRENDTYEHPGGSTVGPIPMIGDEFSPGALLSTWFTGPTPFTSEGGPPALPWSSFPVSG